MGRVAFGTLPTTRKVYSPTSSTYRNNSADVNHVDVIKANVPANVKTYTDTLAGIMYRLGN